MKRRKASRYARGEEDKKKLDGHGYSRVLDFEWFIFEEGPLFIIPHYTSLADLYSYAHTSYVTLKHMVLL